MFFVKIVSKLGDLTVYTYIYTHSIYRSFVFRSSAGEPEVYLLELVVF